jgi:hypothetical protein
MEEPHTGGAKGMAWKPATNVKEGDEVRSDLTGDNYIIETIVHSMVVLKSKDGEKEIITGIDSLRAFYKRKEEANSSPRLPNSPPLYPSENF